MYENLIEPQLQILERCKSAWDSIMPSLPEDLSPYGVPGLTKTDIEKSFSMVINRLKSIKSQVKEERNPFLVQVLGQTFPSLTTPIESWIPSATSYMSSINSHLSALWTTLNSFEPTKEELNRLVSDNRSLEAEAKNLLKITANLTRKKEELSEALAQSKRITKEYNELLAEVQKSKVVIETDALIAVAHREGIVNDKAETDAQLKILKAVTEKLPEFEEKRDAITKQCDDILVEAKNRLKAASKVGMAVSFNDQAKAYVWPRIGWFFLFLASLVGIVGIGYYFTVYQDSISLELLQKLPKMATTKESVNTNSDYYTKLINSLKFIPLSLPFVWLAWFSALKFSQLGRLREDYQFKVATALALDGYTRQVAEVKDPKLTEKLLDLAITNFGENPLRLLTKDSAKDAHPLAGIIDEKGWSEVLKEGLQSIANKVSK